jgi:hypothetical protein
VDESVVEAAEQAAVLDVGVAAVGPGQPGVVGIRPGRRSVAAGEHAAAVALPEGDLLSRAEQPSGPAEVERYRRAAQTIGRMPALQASRRASPADRSPPVDNAAVPTPLRRFCSSTVTTRWH